MAHKAENINSVPLAGKSLLTSLLEKYRGGVGLP